MSKKILIIGHPLVVNANREVWSYLAKDYDVDLVVPKTWKSNLIPILNYEYDEKIDSQFNKVHVLNVYLKGNGSFYFFKPGAFHKVLKNKYDQIILTQETWSFSLFFLYLIKKMTVNAKTPIFLWVCQNIKKQNLYFLRFFERLISQDVTRILGCCSETAEVHNWKKLSPPSYYLPFSFNSQNFDIGPKNENQINVGYIGRITEEKGISDIIQLVEKNKDNEGLSFHVAGGGNLTSFIEECEAIKYHGILKHDEAHKFYQQMDILLLPSKTREFWKEQFGRVIVEAAASGVIVVGSNSGAIPEVMTLVGFKKYIFDENDFSDFEAKFDLAVKDKKANIDIKLFREKAISLFSHQAVANLVSHYISQDDNKGHISGVGKIKGFIEGPEA